MTNMKIAQKVAEEMGASFEIDESTAYAYAPEGKIWIAEGTTLLVQPFRILHLKQPDWKREAAADIIARMRCGLEPDPQYDSGPAPVDDFTPEVEG